MAFINRKMEIEELRALTASKGPSLALLFGRRRVGKTYLLDHAWREKERFYFLFGDTTPERNRDELLREFAGWSGRDIVFEDYPTWRTIFRLLLSHDPGHPWTIVLDEFQYVMGTSDGVVSQLNAVWDREVDEADVTVVLSGSEVATMSALAEADSPLYGRLAWRHRLEPFGYRHTSEMVAHLSRRDQLYTYGIFGGLPRYLAAIRHGEALTDAVKRTVLSRRGEVHLQLENIIKQERGIRDHAAYRAVLAAVARGATGTNDISQKSGLHDDTQTRRALETLTDLGLVRREQYFDAGARAGYLNRIADHAIGFWYRFVEPNRSQLELDKVDEVWEKRVAPYLDDYMGRIFEQVAAEAFTEHHEAWGLPAPREWRRWEGQDRNRRSIELDIVARLGDDRLVTGEVKWSSSPVGPSIHNHLTRNLEDLGRSGRGWAKDALADDRRIYFSAAGFDPAFEALAESEEITLISIDELFD